jgi:hypothetical protein
MKPDVFDLSLSIIYPDGEVEGNEGYREGEIPFIHILDGMVDETHHEHY